MAAGFDRVFFDKIICDNKASIENFHEEMVEEAIKSGKTHALALAASWLSQYIYNDGRSFWNFHKSSEESRYSSIQCELGKRDPALAIKVISSGAAFYDPERKKRASIFHLVQGTHLPALLQDPRLGQKDVLPGIYVATRFLRILYDDRDLRGDRRNIEHDKTMEYLKNSLRHLLVRVAERDPKRARAILRDFVLVECKPLDGGSWPMEIDKAISQAGRGKRKIAKAGEQLTERAKKTGQAQPSRTEAKRAQRRTKKAPPAPGGTN